MPKRPAPRAARAPIGKAWTAIVCGDGRVLPIIESIGRRVLREIDPEGREGRALLASAKVALWSDASAGAQRVPVTKVLEGLAEGARRNLTQHPRDARWRAHHRELRETISRRRRELSH